MESQDLELKFRRFHDLMAHRVREVLLVSTPYDAFILEEDGRLTERLFIEYSELNLTSAPRVTHVETGAEALEALETRRFDLVLATLRISDMDVFALGRKVKERFPGKPVVILAMDDVQLKGLPSRLPPEAIDRVFLWTGDAKILLAIIKHIEDRQNVAADIESADIRVIVVVEDSVRHYSVFCALLYSELMRLSQSLIAEGVNALHRLMRMRARPKILLATTYEEAIALYDEYRNNVLAVISDLRFPKGGVLSDEAGFDLAAHVRKDDASLPVMLQSAEKEKEARALALGAKFVDKNDPALLAQIRQFLLQDLGFGDFVFRMPDGREVARVSNLFELEQALETVPAASLEYHARQNHISNWLMARSEFELAQTLRPRRVSDFPTIEDVRAYIIRALRESRAETQRGAIADFSPSHFDPKSSFIRVGGGSIGGKARGLAFVNALLVRKQVRDRFPGLPIVVPQTIALGTDVFDEFLEANRLHALAYREEDDSEIRRAFCEARFPAAIRENLGLLLENIHHPLAVRSSSLLEDSQFRPFAGIYATVMLPNNDPDPLVRLDQLCTAVKLVYASTFSANAKAYMRNTPNRIEEEKMAVVVQELVGARHGDRFYPTLAGVAQSYNYYPIQAQRAEEGVAQIVLGLGRAVVEGRLALRFSPRRPQILPQFAGAQAFLRNTQRSFYALNLAEPRPDLAAGQYVTLCECGLEDAEKDGTLALVASTYDAGDDAIRDDLEKPGPRVVTFNNVLKHGAIALAPALDYLLRISAEGMGGPVEIEFAVEMGDFGRPAPRGGERRAPTFYFLQLRPMVARETDEAADMSTVPPAARLCFSTSSMGFGVLDDIRDLVYVRRENFDAARTGDIAREIGAVNRTLVAEGRPFILVGPGRWGSSDPWLGIPVQWSQISGVRVIVEASPEWFRVEPSQGTHFFQNITSLRIGYLTISPNGSASGSCPDAVDFLDWDWLGAQEAVVETDHLRHLRFDAPLRVVLDGKTGCGLIAKPGIGGGRNGDAR